MEPVTHALASLALGRAGLGRATRLATPMLLVAGVAADADWISHTAGAAAFVQWHRTATHSLLGMAAISAGVAAGFWLWARRGEASRRIRYLPALAVCAAGAGLHLLLDLTNDAGMKLLWPFGHNRTAWDWAREVDPWLLAILLAGLLVPALLRLVGEEIGARGRKQPGVRGAIATLCVAALYLGARGMAHQRAGAILDSHTYQRETPIRTGAFPAASPLQWRGVVETETAVHEVNISLLPGVEFDARAARSRAKPENSPLLQRAIASDAAQAFLAFARFPMARVEPTQDGIEVRIEDLGTAAAGTGSSEVVAVIEVNTRAEITRSELAFVAGTRQ